MKVEGSAVEERVASGVDVPEKVYPTVGAIGGTESGVPAVDSSLQAFQADRSLPGKGEVAQTAPREGEADEECFRQWFYGQGRVKTSDCLSRQGLNPNCRNWRRHPVGSRLFHW